jgi:hypothetical protein
MTLSEILSGELNAVIRHDLLGERIDKFRTSPVDKECKTFRGWAYCEFKGVSGNKQDRGHGGGVAWTDLLY